MSRKKGPIFRVTGLPASQPDDELTRSLNAAIDDNLEEEERSKSTISVVIVPSCYENDEKVALVEFHGGAPAFLSELTDNPIGDWQVEMGDTDINFDQHFFGFTQLYMPKIDSPVAAEYVVFRFDPAMITPSNLSRSVIAIAGLEGHAYESWRGMGNLGRMWLRDFLSKDLPCCRTMIYGYNSKLSTHGIDTIMDYGRGLMEELKKIRDTDEVSVSTTYYNQQVNTILIVSVL
jgi:protein SERAC1